MFLYILHSPVLTSQLVDLVQRLLSLVAVADTER